MYEASLVHEFTEATFTYWMCVFDVPAEDDPASWSVSVSSPDDGVLVLVNGDQVGTLTLWQSGSWSLDSAIRPGERNTLVVVLVDNASGARSMSSLSLERGGVFYAGP